MLYKGTEAICHINRLEKRGGNGKSGMIEIQPLYLVIGKNKILPLSASPDVKGSDHRNDQSQIVNGLVAALSQNLMDYQLLKNENNFNRQQNQLATNQRVYEDMVIWICFSSNATNIRNRASNSASFTEYVSYF